MNEVKSRVKKATARFSSFVLSIPHTLKIVKGAIYEVKLRYVWIALVAITLLLSGCKDNIPVENFEGQSESDDNSSKEKRQNIDKEIEKEREKIKDYMDTDMDEVIEHQNKAMEALEKAENMDTDKEQYEAFVNDTLPKAKQALEEAKALKGDGNPIDLVQLEDKLIQPLHTFVNMLEYKIDAMKAKTEQEKQQLEKNVEKYSEKYVKEIKAYYDKLEAMGKKYDLTIHLDNLKGLKEQIERTLEIAKLLHISGDNLKQLVAFQQEALNALHDLVEDHSNPDRERIKKWKENLLPDLDSILDRDEDREFHRDQLSDSFDQLKKATKESLDALELKKEGIDQNDKNLIEKSDKKYKKYEKEMDTFRSNLEDAKSKIDEIKNRDD